MTGDVVATQRAALDAAYRRRLGRGDRYALVDFPDHPNVGDSAIWAGEIAILRAITGRDPDHVCCWHDFDADAYRRAAPDGVLLIHGGGNLGDIWPHHQRFRETLLRTVRDRPVVQLPQSIRFRDPAGAARFAKAAAAHPDFTLWVRDHASLAFARDRLGIAAELVPDSAFALSPPPPPAPAVPLLALMRTDDEGAGHDAAALRRAGAEVADWLDEAPPAPAPRTRIAEARVARGLALLARGERIVTDRLHGHILATLLGIAHVALDNDYGKTAAYLDAWTGASPLVTRARDVPGAIALLHREAEPCATSAC